MLTTVLMTIVLFGLLFSAMAIGVILANKPVQGSCGGLGASGLKADCKVCSGNLRSCASSRGRRAAADDSEGRDARRVRQRR
ncbi:MAG: (Na+)-NQR maturation NqrM [Chromatiales bacterium]|nr:(Na+)-NQR maturation NqrM [Chromatiales bacterium]